MTQLELSFSEEFACMRVPEDREHRIRWIVNAHSS